MKNYSLNGNEARDFILNYEIVDNDINVNYADGESKSIAYSIDEEKAILERMKEQVLNSKALLADTNAKFDIFCKLFMDEMLLLVMFIISVFSVGMPLMAIIMGLGIFSGAIGLTSYKVRKYHKLRNDIRKHWLFLDNEDCLNGVIRNNPEVARSLDDRLRSKVLNEDKGMTFSLNTIGDIGYRELKQVYNQAEYVAGKRKYRARKRNRT